MSLKDIIHLGIQAAKGKDNIKKGSIGFAGFGFVFRDITLIAEIFGVEYTSGICRLGTTRELLKACDNGIIEKYNNIINYTYNQTQDLYYAGAIKTLVPTLKFGGDELLFEVGMIVNTPKGEIFPATFYWSVGGLTIGGWKQDLLRDFIALKEFDQAIKFNPIRFKNMILRNWLKHFS